MAHIVGICEMGGYLGHITKIITLLREFARHGHQCTIIVPDLGSAEVIRQCGFELGYILGPTLPMPTFTRSREPVNFSEVLLCAGMGTLSVLSPAAMAWRYLLQLIQPSLVLYDYAPTAVLASRGLPFKQVVIGTGFSVPPPVSPLPQFNRRLAIKTEHLATAEQQLLQTLNEFLKSQGQSPLAHVYDLFLQVDKSCVVSAAEVDGYAHLRTAMRYLAMVQSAGQQQSPLWTEKGLKIFAYLKTEYIHLREILVALQQSAYSSCVFISGKGAEAFLALATPNLMISLAPFDMQQVVAQADWMIYHAGCGTATQAVMHGIGSLVIPIYYEQLITASALENNQLGVTINPLWSAGQAVQILNETLENSDILTNCQALKMSQQASYGLDQFIEECLAILV